MEHEVEPMQQPIRRIVGRKRTQSERIVALENLNHFLKQHPPAALVRREGEYFPVRKIVGRPRS